MLEFDALPTACCPCLCWVAEEGLGWREEALAILCMPAVNADVPGVEEGFEELVVVVVVSNPNPMVWFIWLVGVVTAFIISVNL